MGAASSVDVEVGVLDWDASVFPKHGVMVGFLKSFVAECGGRSALTGKTTADVCNDHLKPATEKSQSSLCDLLRHMTHDAYGEKAAVFVSHAWRYEFLDVVDALLHHFRDKEDAVIWFDLFSNNQHKATSLEYEWWENTFKSAIADFQHTVMVLSPWHDPIPYTRAWCIFEAYCSASTNCKFEIAMSEKEQDQFLQDVADVNNDAINCMLATIDARKSECHVAEDKERIFAVIEQSIGFNKINSLVFEQFRDWVIAVARNDLDTKLETLGDSHEDTLSSRSSLARLYDNQGKYEEAQSLYEACWEIRRSTLGENHPTTLTALSALAYLYDNQGRFDTAQILQEKCLQLRKLALGDRHPDTLDSMSNLGRLYAKQGQNDMAQPLYEDCLELYRDTMGDTDLNTLRSMNNLALLYANQEKYEAARPLYENCLELSSNSLGQSHADTLRTMNNLALLHANQSNYEKAQQLYEKCLELYNATLGESHPETITAMNNLAGLFERQVRYDDAQQLYDKCLKLSMDSLGETHPDTLRSMNNLACIYDCQRNMTKPSLCMRSV